MAYKPPSDPAKAAKKKAAIEARIQKKNENKKKKEEKKANKANKKNGMKDSKDGAKKKKILKKPSMPSMKKKVSPDGAKKEVKSKDDETKGLKKIDLFGKDAKAKNAVLEEEKAQLEQKTNALERQLGNMSMKTQRAKQMMQQAMMALW